MKEYDLNQFQPRDLDHLVRDGEMAPLEDGDSIRDPVRILPFEGRRLVYQVDRYHDSSMGRSRGLTTEVRVFGILNGDFGEDGKFSCDELDEEAKKRAEVALTENNVHGQYRF